MNEFNDIEIAYNSKPNNLYSSEFRNGIGRYLHIIQETEENKNIYNFTLSKRIKIQITHLYKDNIINGLKIVKYDNFQEVEKIVLSKFEIQHIESFLELIKKLNLSSSTEHNMAMPGCSTSSTQPSKLELINFLKNQENSEIIIKLLSDGVINSKDIVNTGYRKQELNIFKKLLETPSFIDEYKESQNLQKASEEKVWQYFFKKNFWIFGYGLAYRFQGILMDEAHLSNTDINGRNSVIGDFLLADTRFTTFVEIKKPSTALFSQNKNRSNSWKLSSDLISAHSQILEQKASGQVKLEQGQFYDLNGNTIRQKTYDAKTILIIGSWSELKSDSECDRQIKEKTFELFRRDLRNVEIITFDELYERAFFIAHHSN